jgi:SH3-like domain-containing protein
MKYTYWGLIFGVLMQAFCNSIAEAAPEKLPVPRFVCLRSKKVNVHVGPGKEYPTDWTFVRQDLPVEVIAEFDTWRQIKDFQGTTGWVHKSLLAGKRTALVRENDCKLRDKPDDEAKVIAILKENVIVRLKECKADWCRIDVNGHTGWVPRKHIWGVYDHEEKFK